MRITALYERFMLIRCCALQGQDVQGYLYCGPPERAAHSSSACSRCRPSVLPYAVTTSLCAHLRVSVGIAVRILSHHRLSKVSLTLPSKGTIATYNTMLIAEAAEWEGAITVV